MTLYLVSFVIILLAFLGLAIGVLMGREPLKGSCGGLGGAACGQCMRPCPKRRNHQEDEP